MYQQAEADYKLQKVLIASLAQKLKLAGININAVNENNISGSVNIYSPINGFVTRVNVNIGKYVSPTDVLFELVNPSDIHLSLTVFEKDLSKLFVGQKLQAYTNNQTDKKYNCEVLLIGKDLSLERNTEVHCHFETYDKSLIPGTYMNADVEVKSVKTNVLPSDAVLRFEGKNYVFADKRNNQYEIKEVTTGENENGFTEVLTNYDAETSFVVKGAYSLLMMMKNRSEE
jgi:membrane fusion protein, heavy metal efflux system